MQQSRFLLWLGVMLALLAGTATAQEDSEGFQVDLTAGIFNSNIINNGSSVGSALTNLYGGLRLISPTIFSTRSQKNPSNFKLSLNPRYQILGADFTNPRYKHKFHYFALPLNGRYQLFSGFDIVAGASAGYLLANFRTNNNSNTEDFPIEDPSILHLWGSAGVEFDLSKKIGLQLSYQRSIQQLPADHHFRSFRVGLSYQLYPLNNDYESGTKIKPEEKAARNHIRRLEKGILLVRLPSQRKQIKHLKQELQNLAKNSEAYAEKKEKLITLRKRTQIRNNRLIAAFQKTFDFCDYAFFYDYQTDTILSSKWHSIAFKQKGKPGKAIAPDQPRYVLDVGESYLKRYHRSYEGMVIRDTTLHVIKPPFPAKIPNMKTFQFLGLQKKPKRMVRKLENELKTFSKKYP